MGKKETSSLSDDFLHSLGQDFSVLRDIVVNNPYAILLFDKDGYFLFANKSFLTNFKYSVPAEYSIFKDPNIQQIAHHEDWLSTIKGGHTLDIPELWYDIQKFTSEALEQKKCFHITIFPISIASTIKYYGIMIDDITEKTRIQKELVQYRDHLEELVKERERRIIQEQDLLRNFVYNNPYAIGIFGKNGNFIQSNPAFIQIFRSLPPKDFTIFSSAFQAKYSDKLQQLKQLKKGEKLIIEETWYNLHEIHPILPENRLGLRITVFPLNNVDNKPDNFVIMIEDVTKKMEYEEELAKKDIEVQYFGIISMISSMFIHDITKIDENISSSLNKLGDSINCSAVFLFQHIQTNKEQKFLNRWHWTPNRCQFDPKRFEDFLSQSFLSEYSKELPMNLYSMINLANTAKYPEITNILISEMKLRSLMMVPVFVGKDRFGSIVAVHTSLERDFTQKDIQLSLNVGIIIGLALKNATNLQFMGNFFDALGNLEAGIFIGQVDNQGKFHIVYVNTYASKMIGKPVELIYQQKSFFDFVDDNDVSYIQEIYRARYLENNQKIPMTYKVRIKTEHGPRTMQMAISVGQYNDKIATYGLLVEWHSIQKLKSVQEIFEEFIQNTNQK